MVESWEQKGSYRNGYLMNFVLGIRDSIITAPEGYSEEAITELENQVRAIVNGHPVEISTYPRQIAFNVLPQIDKFTDTGYTKEEHCPGHSSG